MKPHCKLAATLLLLSTLNFQLSTARAQGTGFTYQGRLTDGAAPANGSYDLRFTLYDAVSGGAVQSGPLLNAPTTVSNGLFTVALDFGAGVFNGNKRWLEIGARTNGGTAFTSLSPRQPITPTPYAVTAGSVTGGVPDPQIPGTIPRLSLGNTFTAPQTFSGTAQSMLNLSSSHTGGTWLNLGSSDAGGKTWNLISSATANGEGPGKLLFRDASYGVVLTLSSNGNVGIGTTSPGNPLDVTVAGTTNGGVAGFPEVVAHFRRSPGSHSAISLDSAANQDGVLYFSESGGPVWGVRHDSQPDHDFQLRYHAGGANIAMWTVKTNGNVGIGTTTPAAKLDVNGSIRAGGGFVFPDGSVQTRAAEGSTSPTTASGHPAGTTVSVTLNGIPCFLDGLLSISNSVSVEKNGGSVTLTRSALGHARVRVKRVRPAGTSDWAVAFGNIARAGISPSNPTNWFTLVVTVTQPGGATQSVSFGPFLFTSYALRGDGGQLFEAADLYAYQSPLNVVRGGSLPATIPSADVPGLSVLTNGVVFPGVVLADLPLIADGPVVGVVGLAITNVVIGVSLPLTQTMTLRANFSSGAGFLSWLQAPSSLGESSVAVRQGGTTLVAAGAALGKIYRLRLADDGLPIEEVDVVYANLTTP